MPQVSFIYFRYQRGSSESVNKTPVDRIQDWHFSFLVVWRYFPLHSFVEPKVAVSQFLVTPTESKQCVGEAAPVCEKRSPVVCWYYKVYWTAKLSGITIQCRISYTGNVFVIINQARRKNNFKVDRMCFANNNDFFKYLLNRISFLCVVFPYLYILTTSDSCSLSWLPSSNDFNESEMSPGVLNYW